MNTQSMLAMFHAMTAERATMTASGAFNSVGGTGNTNVRNLTQGNKKAKRNRQRDARKLNRGS